VRVQTYGSDAAINLEPGLSGGAPGRAGDFGFVRGSSLESLLARSEFPGSLDMVREKLGEPARLDPRISTPMDGKDVFVVGQSGSGGFGDPILRSPEVVAEDVRNQSVSHDLAQRVYGVSLDKQGGADLAATEARRAQIRTERLTRSGPELRTPDHSKLAAKYSRWRVGDSLIAVGESDAWNWACAHCDCRLAPLHQNYKHGCRVISASPERIDAVRFPNPKQFSDAPMVARQYLCPSCATLLGTEFCLTDDEPFHDVQIDIKWLAEHTGRAAPPSPGRRMDGD
jgi:N-methylhydantoinase B